MFTFETILILNPTPEDTTITKIKAKYKKLLNSFAKEKKIKVEDMGVKKLAYTIEDKYNEGRYVLFTWAGSEDNVHEAERRFRIDDNVLKFITLASLEDKDKDKDEKEKSEQPAAIIDAEDVLFGLAKYN